MIWSTFSFVPPPQSPEWGFWLFLLVSLQVALKKKKDQSDREMGRYTMLMLEPENILFAT